jgi:hypothetical protein
MSKKDAKDGAVEVRLLVAHQLADGEIVPANVVIAVDADSAAALCGANVADDTPAAVRVGKESAENSAYHKAKADAAKKPK